MELIPTLIEEHGWHVLAELTVLVLATVVTVFWVRALFQGRAQPIGCPRCGRTNSRANPRCPRCGTVLGDSPGAAS